MDILYKCLTDKVKQQMCYKTKTKNINK